MISADETQRTRWIGAATIAIVACAVVVFAVRWQHRDVIRCRDVLVGLAMGNMGVQRSINWEVLEALSGDFGAVYRQLPDEANRLRYREAFIAKFAEGFRQTGGSLAAFGNWRVVEKSNGHVVIATDAPSRNQTVLFDLNRQTRLVEKIDQRPIDPSLVPTAPPPTESSEEIVNSAPVETPPPVLSPPSVEPSMSSDAPAAQPAESATCPVCGQPGASHPDDPAQSPAEGSGQNTGSSKP